jgi:glycosyltransferase involved in cell wall biosynthesis
MSDLVLVVPGPLDQLTGGYLYDRHIVDALRGRGRAVRVIDLSATGAEDGLAELADAAVTVVDGLALPELEPAIATHAHRLRLVAFVHHPLAEETGLRPTAAQRLAAVEAALLPRFRGVLCPSRATAAAVARAGVAPDRIAVVPPGTERPRFPPRRRRHRVRRLLCVAGVVPRKGHLVLIRALARLRDLDWRLLCVGSLRRDPSAARSVRRLIRALDLGRRVALAGERPPRAAASAYRWADAFVLPSFHEGYGMAYAEAMAHGLPVVATNAGAVADTVPHGAGLLVAPGDAAALARALRRLIAEPPLAARLAAGSRAAGAQQREWPAAAAEWEAACGRLAALDPPAPALEPRTSIDYNRRSAVEG